MAFIQQGLEDIMPKTSLIVIHVEESDLEFLLSSGKLDVEDVYGHIHHGIDVSVIDIDSIPAAEIPALFESDE